MITTSLSGKHYCRGGVVACTQLSLSFHVTHYTGLSRIAYFLLDMRFPSISPGAAQWLVDNRDIYVVGIDTTSIEWEPGKYKHIVHIVT